MAKDSSGAKILIIDDDDDLAIALARLLEHNGYQVVRAANGDEGLKMAGSESPDLIFLDFMMPVRDGFDVCRTLDGGNRKVPVIALTAFGQDIGQIHGLSEGASCIVDFIEKPYEANILLERVETALSGA